MRSAKQLLAIILCLLMCLPSVSAQDLQSAATISKEITIIIERQQLRFIAQKAVEEMRLQIFDQAGEFVFDSGAGVQPETVWSQRNGGGGQ